MKVDHLDELIAAAHSAGILPPSATRTPSDGKPWPVVLLVGLGAWLSAVPLFAFLAFAGGRELFQGAGAYLLGTLMLAAGVTIFRSSSTSVFVEQLGLPVLLAGGALIWAGVLDQTNAATACLVLAGINVAVSILVPRAWLRVLLGAFACCLITFSMLLIRHTRLDLLWVAAHTTMLAWLAASALRRRAIATLAMAVESVGAGWLAVTLISLAAASGATFMLSQFGFGPGDAGGEGLARYMSYRYLVSAAAAAGGVALLAKSWPAVRTIPALIVAIVVVGLSWLNATLGATFLVLAICMVSGRWRLATAAGIAAAWIIGAFYYQLNLPLASKALIMLGTAATLGGVAWVAMPETAVTADKAPRLAAPRNIGFAAIALSGLAVLAVINTGIWQKERLIAQSQSMFVELVPVDPRSLMQGDYMALDFRIPTATAQGAPCGSHRCMAVAKADGRGIVTMSRLSAGEPLGAGEFLIELTRRRGRWAMVTDAWHFREGEADRWARAKYGEFRVDSAGRALLVGMRGPNLEAL
jgi:uncharacterized membrane-anchored protein